MSLQQVLDAIDAKVTIASKQVQEVATYVSQCIQALEKITADRTANAEKLLALQGYIQALNENKEQVKQLMANDEQA